MTPVTACPPFEHVRLATAKDLPRIAAVAAAGFYWSPVFQYQRPYFASYPEDTVSSYFAEYQAALQDPGSVVIVSEDIVEETETEHLYEALRRTPVSKPQPDANRRVIVGVCSITLKKGSQRVGQFQPGHVELPTRGAELQIQQRDQHAGAAKAYSSKSGPAKARHLSGHMRLSTVAVHPAYWRRGHGSRLINWCTRLADCDGVPIGVSSAPTGVQIALKAGFEQQERVRIEGYIIQQDPTIPKSNGERLIPGLELWIGIRRPCLPPPDLVIPGPPLSPQFAFWSTQAWMPQTEDVPL